MWWLQELLELHRTGEMVHRSYWSRSLDGAKTNGGRVLSSERGGSTNIHNTLTRAALEARMTMTIVKCVAFVNVY